MIFQGKRILITGNNGFVGKALENELKRKGAEVIGIDVKSGSDVRNMNHLQNIKDVDIVHHLAAMMYVPFSWENPHIVYEVNVLGTLNVLEYCRTHDVKKIVFASSYLYGKPKYLPIDEKHPINPQSPYARSKKIAEDMCQGYSEDFGLNCIILRPFNIYGPGQNEIFLIPTIVNQLVKGRINLNDPEPKRDYVYVKDAVNAYVNATEYDGSDFEIFNIGSGVSYSVDEIVKKLINISEKEVPVDYRNKRRENEVMDVIADTRKAKEKLGWTPKVNINEGLKNTMDAVSW